MRESSFKQAIIITLLGHVAFFGVFTFSFGRPIVPAMYPDISFWGQVLYNSQVSPVRQKNAQSLNKGLFLKPDISMLDEQISPKESVAGSYLKPQTLLVLGAQKHTFVQVEQERPSRLKRKEPTILFHPLLPYSFPLYFKDRQVAHVELEFNIVSSPTRSFTVVKRKVSSGNLEVDLLSMRYIGRYLFMQRQRFPPNTWQTVKIDLSKDIDRTSP
jgi:hypothetical protein